MLLALGHLGDVEDDERRESRESLVELDHFLGLLCWVNESLVGAANHTEHRLKDVRLRQSIAHANLNYSVSPVLWGARQGMGLYLERFMRKHKRGEETKYTKIDISFEEQSKENKTKVRLWW